MRRIILSDQQSFVSNRVITSKYTLLSFLPLALMEQFRRFANLFFLLLIILQIFPIFATVDPLFAALPTIIIVFAACIKDGMEDLKRHKIDRVVNARLCTIIVNGVKKDCLWKDLKVGDVVELHDNEFIPADLVIISTSENGVCYVETKNLDGETNLKVRKQVSDLNLNEVKFVEIQNPHSDLYAFNGYIQCRDRYSISINEVLLRGCLLRNTKFVLGIVCCTGVETKLQLNSGLTKTKRSVLERKMNSQVLVNLAILCLICIVSATGSGIWQSSFWGFIAFWNALIAFQNIVPISLYLTIEMVKTLQSYFIYLDEEIKVVPKSWNLADDLGQIEYVFSDKTGTLTQNIMEFKKASINGQMYQNPKINLEDGLFWKLIAVCHTVLVTNNEYKAQSPDELALVRAAKELGCAFFERKDQNVFVDFLGQKLQFTLMAVLEFTSQRKRMSVVCRDANNQIFVFTKGADSVIDTIITSSEIRAKTYEHLEAFAMEGLRTLCLCYRIISEEEFLNWIQKYHFAQNSIENREQLLDSCAVEIEKNLVLLGATAIEDRLQDKVPESIQILRDMGIKIWVLTGDKMETAISIGFSCNLLSNEMTLVTVHGSSLDKSTLLESLKSFSSESKALIIDGEALKWALEPELRDIFAKIAMECRVVVCCRVSPLQKAMVVQLVRKNHVTCAIGDGANDVSMIQSAHVGVGISGQEGMQAAMSSDYAVGQFRDLVRLLLVHGRWNYMRISNLIFNYFYKDLVFVMIIFWFQFYSQFSTQQPFDFTFMLYYNLFFTNWPVFVMGIFDRDVPDHIVLQVPQLYQEGIKQILFTWFNFFIFMLEGCYQSLIFYYVCMYTYLEGQYSTTGRTGSLFEMGTCMACASITAANLFIIMNTRAITIVNLVALVPCSLMIFYGYVAIYFFIPSPSFGLYIVWSSPVFYFCLLLSLFISLLPRLIFLYIQKTYYPKDMDILTELYKLKLQLPKKKQKKPNLKINTQNMLSPVSQVHSAEQPKKKTHQRAYSLATATIRFDKNRGYSFSHDETGIMSKIIMSPSLQSVREHREFKISPEN